MSNFLSNYMTYASGNEVPENYHIWSALSALSSIISRRVWVDLGYFQVTANLYVVLVGPPGNGKTTAMAITKGLVRELGTIPFSAEAQTKESLVKEMKEYERAFDYEGKPRIYTPYAIMVTELSHFLGPSAAHMIDFLTTIYDQPVYDTKTKNKGNDLIIGPYVTVLSCTTGDWITLYLKSDIISGGFSRRAIFVNEEENKKRIPFPEISDVQRAAYDAVLSHAHGLATVAGPFVWDPPAKAWYDSWYRTREISRDPVIHCYSRTKGIQLIKVAMLVSLSSSPELVLRLEPLQVALEMLDRIEKMLPQVFQGMGRNELASVATKVMDIVRGIEYIAKKKLEGLLFREAQSTEIYSVLRHLQETGQIVIFSMQTKDTPLREYIATPEMAQIIQKRLQNET